MVSQFGSSHGFATDVTRKFLFGALTIMRSRFGMVHVRKTLWALKLCLFQFLEHRSRKGPLAKLFAPTGTL